MASKTLTLEACLDALIDYRGKTPKKTDSGIPLVTAKIVKSGRIEIPDEFIANSDYEAWMTRGYPRLGDVVLTTEAPLGEVGQVKFLPIALAQRIVTLRGKEGVLDNGYLLYLLQSKEMQAQLAGRASGTTVIGIKQSELRKVELQLPALEEQRATAEILGALDDRIDNLRQTNATLEAIAATLFKSWFVDFDGVAPEDMQESELGLIPKGWRVGTVNDLAEIKGGKQLEKEHFDQQGANPVFGGAGEMGRTDLHNADGFLITVGRVGAYCGQFFWHLGSAWVNNNASRIVVGDDAGFWLYWVLRHLDIEKIKKGAAQPFVSNSDLAAMNIVIPDDGAISSFNSLASDLHKQMRRAIQQVVTLSDLRDTLLPRLVSG